MSASSVALGLRKHAQRILARPRQPLAAPPRAHFSLEQLRSQPARVRAAEAELLEVHRVELAWLLRSAARLAIARETEGAQLLRQLDEEPPSLAAWRAALLDALRCAAADGLRCPRALAETLARCAASAPAAWDPPVELALASLRVEPCAEGRLVLALALQASARHEQAAGLLAAELLDPGRHASHGLRARWLAALICCERMLSPVAGCELESLARHGAEARA